MGKPSSRSSVAGSMALDAENKRLKEQIDLLTKRLAGQSELKDPNLSLVQSGEDACTLSYIGEEISDVNHLLEAAGIDRMLWEVVEVKVNNWEVAGKKRQGQDGDGRWLPDQIWKTPLRQYAIKLRRLAPKFIQDTIRDLLKDVPRWRGSLPSVKPKSKKADHLLEVSLSDAHFGKLCWGMETGTDYDLSIAVNDYAHATSELLDRTGHCKVDRVLFPIGSDFFQVNNWKNETANGTAVDSVDDRFQKVFAAGCDSVIDSILRFREIAHVDVIWIPGNHDRATSWYMSELIRRIFQGDKRVEVDNGPDPRKYRLYGLNLIGYDHGDGMAMEKLPLVMATEASDLWSKSVYRHYRIGHFHKKKQVRWVGMDTFNGVEVTVLPSLSGSDSWHHSKGYVKNHRTAEATLWDKSRGPVATFMVEAESAIVARKK